LNAGSGQAADITFDAPPVWVPDVDGGHWAARLRTPTGTVSVAVHAPGRHNLHNALAAATAAYAAGVPCPAIFEGLDQFRPVKGRSQTRGLVLDGRLVTLIDDSYNANPDSVRAAIDLLAELPGPRWLVLGEMGEVGGQGPAFHAEVGRHAREAGLQALWTAGPAARDAASAFGPDARAFDDTAALIAALDERPACQAVLVKGSRYMRMETIVQALAGLHAPSAAPASGQEG
jgi:UDP-N-acetylmuramoyl-tripeptide--D-alanyl-D-alanine ligase